MTWNYQYGFYTGTAAGGPFYDGERPGVEVLDELDLALEELARLRTRLLDRRCCGYCQNYDTDAGLCMSRDMPAFDDAEACADFRDRDRGGV